MELLLQEIFSKIKIAFDGKEALEQYKNFYEENNSYPDPLL